MEQCEAVIGHPEWTEELSEGRMGCGMCGCQITRAECKTKQRPVSGWELDRRRISVQGAALEAFLVCMHKTAALYNPYGPELKRIQICLFIVLEFQVR